MGESFDPRFCTRYDPPMPINNSCIGDRPKLFCFFFQFCQTELLFHLESDQPENRLPAPVPSFSFEVPYGLLAKASTSSAGTNPSAFLRLCLKYHPSG